MVPKENSHKPMPTKISTGCFSYTSRLKWCLKEHLPQPSAQYTIYRMFHLHIQAEMVPMDNSHKPMPITISTRCFSYTPRLKWFLRGTSSHKTPTQYTLYGMLLLHIWAEMVRRWNYSHKPMLTTVSTGSFS